MIRLHPIPDANYNCPYCQVHLEVNGWYIPGMRNLADLRCQQCNLAFYGDLPSGHGLYYPMLLEQGTGFVHDKYGVKWFANWLRDSYANRLYAPVEFIVETLRPIKKQPILLNCLDTLYGHCLLKILNAQYYLDHRPDFDLIVMIPFFLRWMVPEGVAAIWKVDLPLKQGTVWNDWLAGEIKRRSEPFEMLELSVAFSHPHPQDYDIERFTKISPFPTDKWSELLRRPTITFIWREDRLWQYMGNHRQRQRTGLVQRLKKSIGLVPDPLGVQKEWVEMLAQALRNVFPKIDFAVAGLGRPGGLPSWIADLRTAKIDDHIEIAWCERYAQSHLVIGVHGSNMLLPSAHTGAVIELMPLERWGNTLQDILFPHIDCRETMFRYRIVPASIRPSELATLSISLLRDYEYMMLNMEPTFCSHGNERVWSLPDRRAAMNLNT